MPLFSRPQPVFHHRGIHLDLKGLPPSFERLLALLELLAACRINLLLLEWEDAFPWRREELRSPTAFSHEQVATLLARARELEIEVVPLVQTFGHLQNVLRHEGYAALRELPEAIEDCCPSHPGSLALIAELVDEIASAHPQSRWIHLGGDEVWSLGRCPRCAARLAELGRDGLYLAHLRPLLERVSARGLRPILWDDMARGWQAPALQAIAQQADLMAWSYAADPFGFLPRTQLEAFRAAGLTLWAASAFRGADGATADHPDLGLRARNLGAWAEAAPACGIRAAVATGWARYTTMLAPCESLESALDSLVLAAASMWDGGLGAEAAAEAAAMLQEGELAAWAPAFPACRQAARALAAWRRNDWPLQHLLSHAAVAGEPERRDPAALRHAAEGLRRHLLEGEGLAAAWREAHHGLIDEHWLERYVAARLEPQRRLCTPLLADCERLCAAPALQHER